MTRQLGISSFILLPVGLELAAEVTSQACHPEISSSLLYAGANGLSVRFLLFLRRRGVGLIVDEEFKRW